MKIPPFLKPGDTIGICATARKVVAEDLKFALQEIERRGFKYLLSPDLYEDYHQFAGHDAVRAASFEALLRNETVQAVWCARGGYGSIRILDLVDWNVLSEQPKWICGYSDVTAIHAHVNKNIGLATLHSPMLFAFDKTTQTARDSFFNSLLGKNQKIMAESHPLNISGKASGTLMGGNLSVVYSLLGSTAQPETQDAILFIEDLDEYLYHIDRMMMALKRAGILERLRGLIVGGFTDIHDNAIPFGSSAEEIIRSHVADFGYPVCFGFPAGHISENLSLQMGTAIKLDVGNPVILSNV